MKNLSIGILESSGFLSYLPYAEDMTSEDLVEYYTTTESNEVINFIDTTETNALRHLNGLFIENTGASTMFVRPIPSNHLLVIPAGGNRAYDKKEVTGIQVLGASGQTLRWSGLYY